MAVPSIINCYKINQRQPHYCSFDSILDTSVTEILRSSLLFFQVWHEVLFGKGATNFITGMGGFLQSVLYGYGGLRFHSDRLDLNPTLPLDCTELHLSGVNYLGSSLNIFIQKDSIVVSLVARTEVAPNLVLWIYKTEEIHTLEMNHSVRIPRQRAAITTTGTNQA